MTLACDDDRTALLNPAIARRVEMYLALLRYVDTGFARKPRLQALLWQSIGEEKRRMYMSVYDEMRAEGRAEGRLFGKQFLVHLLSKRGLLLDDELRARLDGCSDEAQLQRWFDRALTATTLAAVFDEP